MCLVTVVIADYQRGHLYLVLLAACFLADGDAHLTLWGPHHLHVVEVHQRLLRRTHDCCSDHCVCSELYEAALEEVKAKMGVCNLSCLAAFLECKHSLNDAWQAACYVHVGMRDVSRSDNSIELLESQLQ